ncbi:helix-turn-helix transcriptional regulator [Paenibacillus tarimensis]
MIREQEVAFMNVRLKALRKSKGFTQAEMAALLGYRSKSGYAMVESGKNNPPLHIALKIALIVESDVDTLFQTNRLKQNDTKMEGYHC